VSGADNFSCLNQISRRAVVTNESDSKKKTEAQLSNNGCDSLEDFCVFSLSILQ